MRDELASAYGGTTETVVHAAPNGIGEPDLASDVAPGPEPVTATRRPKLGVFFWICAAWLGILAFFVLFANFLPLQDPNNIDFTVGRDGGMSWHHLLGTDQDGRDILSRLIYGARTSLIIGLCGTAIGMGIGGTLGMLSAYVRGRFDSALSFFMYCGLAFPAIIAVIAILDFWGRTEFHIILVLGLFSVPLIYRLVRAATLATATKEYITAARSQGATSLRVLFHDVFPNVAPALIAYAVFTLGGIIAIEGAIAFLGLSVSGPSWGNMISDAGGDASVRLVFIFAPAIALFLTLISLNYVGERIRVRYDTGEVKL